MQNKAQDKTKTYSPPNGIPRFFHFSLPGSVSDQMRANIETTRRLHPDWQITIWTDDTPVPNGRLVKYLTDARSGAQRADLIRLDALYTYGGVYLDSDVRVLQPFDHLAKAFDFFIASEDGRNLTNAVIGAVPRHPAIEAIISFLEDNEPDWSLPPNQTTGPVLFSRLLRWRSDVNVLPRETFYPHNWNETERPPHRLSYAQHMWAGSWLVEPKRVLAQRRFSTASKELSKRMMRPLLRAGFSALRRAQQAAERKPEGHLHRQPTGNYSCNREIVASTVHGQKIVLDGRDLSITPGLALHGYHEWPQEAFVRRTLRGGDWFVDVGANVGVFSILAASKCGPLGRVLAFEPNPYVRQLLIKSAAINWFHDRIRIYETALGEVEGSGVLTFFAERLGDGQIDAGAGRAQPFHATGQLLEQKDVQVSMQTLDGVIPVDLPIKIMKIDAEGYEPKVLQGGKRLIVNRAFDFILLEASIELFSSPWKETLASLQMLIEAGYTAGTLDWEGFVTAHRSLSDALSQRGEGKTLVFAALRS
jgi:FkbM family methyltransferase